MANELDTLWNEVNNVDAAVTEDVSLDDLWKSSQTQEIQKQETTPEKKVGFFGSVPESAYNRGERNIVGNIFERPSAAIRSALMGKGYAQGALNPGQVPSFQQTALDAYYKKTPQFPGKTALGMGVSALGMGADILTNPADVLPMVVGASPTIRTAAKAIGGTEPAQAFSRFLNKERQVADITKHMPKIMTDNWLVSRAKTVKLAVDEAVSGVRKEFASIFEPHKELSVSSDTLKAIPKTLLDDMGINKETATVGQLWDARDNLLTQISDATWNKSENLKRLKLKESELVDSVSRLKAAVLNSVPMDTRNALLKLDPKYTEIINLGKELSSKVYKPSTNTYKTSSLVNVYGNPKSSDARVAFKQFQKYNDKIGQVTKDIKKYVGRQNIKKIVGIAGATGIIGGGLAYGLRKKISQPIGNIGE
jgi:hypothetical protein